MEWMKYGHGNLEMRYDIHIEKDGMSLLGLEEVDGSADHTSQERDLLGVGGECTGSIIARVHGLTIVVEDADASDGGGTREVFLHRGGRSRRGAGRGRRRRGRLLIARLAIGRDIERLRVGGIDALMTKDKPVLLAGASHAGHIDDILAHVAIDVLGKRNGVGAITV